jgi:hypothetical protein
MSGNIQGMIDIMIGEGPRKTRIQHNNQMIPDGRQIYHKCDINISIYDEMNTQR